MASIQENEPDSTVYETRVSYLMLLEEKQRALNKKALLHRLVYIAKLSADASKKKNIGDYYEELFSNLEEVHQAEGVSGMLMVYPGYVVHCIESSSDIIYEVLRDLCKMEKTNKPLQYESKILSISHDIPSRLFQQWNSRVLNITSGREEYEGKEGVNELVIDTIASLLKLGVHILKTPKLGVRNAMDSLNETVPELLIPQDQIGFLLKSSELDSPEVFLNRFDRPVDTVLDKEIVWPFAENIALTIK